MVEDIVIRDHVFEPYISREELDVAINNVAERINTEYKASKEVPIFLITLSGATFFAVRLLEKLSFTPKIGFVKCSSYASGMKSSGKIKMALEPTIEISGKNIIILEDIVDTGLTWKFLHDYLLKSGANSVRIASMLFKEEAYKETAIIDWYALKVEDKFLVGMGLDYGELGRNLPTIYKLKTT